MSASALPSISVAVPTHRSTHLMSCVESILNQTLLPTEIVISQDGDDPATAELVQALDGHGISIRRVLNKRALGQLANRNQAFQLTTGELVAMLDDDDEWETTFLEKTVNVLIAHPECACCATDHHIIDGGGRILHEETRQSSQRFGRASMRSGIYRDVLRRQLTTKPFSLHTTLFRRAVLAELGFFPSEAGTVPDFALFLELGARDAAVFYLAERLGKYRVHSEQQTRSRREPSRDQVHFLKEFRSRHEFSDDVERLIAQRFNEVVVELAIAHAHQRERRAALKALAQYGDIGWEVPRIKRILVLIALLGGARKTHSATRRSQRVG